MPCDVVLATRPPKVIVMVYVFIRGYTFVIYSSHIDIGLLLLSIYTSLAKDAWHGVSAVTPPLVVRTPRQPPRHSAWPWGADLGTMVGGVVRVYSDN